MSGELAVVRTLPGSRYGIVQALRQTLEAAVRWGHIQRTRRSWLDPTANPRPGPSRVHRDELDAIAAELPRSTGRLPAFAAATGLRPEEWAALDPRDIDRKAGHLSVNRTVSEDEHGRRILVELAKTSTSRRQVPLSRRALAALDELPPRLPHIRYSGAPPGLC